MGRTFDVLSGRRKNGTSREAPVAIPFPSVEPLPSPSVEVVPFRDDDLPPDNDKVPYIEVGDKKAPSAPVGPQLIAPKPTTPPPSAALAFQLLHPGERPKGPVIGQDLIAYHRPEHPTARQYRRLVDGIAAQHSSGRPPVLLFTGASTASSGTPLVANLGVVRAGDGFGRVLIIEVDSGAASGAGCFATPTAPGLRDVLARTVPLGVAIQRTSVEGVYVLPAGKADIGTDEAERLPSVLDQVRARFEWALVDAPAWGTFPLSEWIKACDGTYLMVKQSEWDSPVSDSAHDGIARAGGRLRGCIVTG